MITSSFNLTATERVLPKLELDFTTASLDNRITFTRALNTATRVNSSGLIETVTANLPRFDYDPVTLDCKGLLIEEARTNSVPNSNDFTALDYSLTDATIETVSGIDPQGGTSVTKLKEGTGTGLHFLTGPGFTVGVTYAMSIYAKKAERKYLRIAGMGFNAAGFDAIFNLDNGTMFLNTGSRGFIQPAGNGWYRCWITFAPTNINGISIQTCNDSGNFSYTGDGSSGFYIYGLDVQAGSFITSHIPTTGTPLTRNADVATMTGTNFSNWWAATTGGAVISLIPKSTSTLAYLSFDDNTANNKIILANSTTSGQTKITSSGVLQATLTAGTITTNATNKVSAAWNTNNCAATANATTPDTTSSATIPTVSQLRIGSDGTAYANAWIQKVSYWPQRIINAEITAFSKQ